MSRKQSTRSGRSLALLAIGVGLIGLAPGNAGAPTFRFSLASREKIKDNLREYSGSNSERGARLAQMFIDAARDQDPAPN